MRADPIHRSSARRGLYGRVVLTLALAAAPAAAAAQDITVTLLGTGAPPPAMHRFGPSTLVEAGGRRFLFDVGRGALQRLAQTGVRWQDVDVVYFTHLHSDHVVGFPDAWLSGWLVAPGRNRPLDVVGPAGTADMVSHLARAFEFDIRYRQSDDRAVPAGVTVRAQDISEGVVYDSAGVRVTVFEVDHSPVRPAFGYRVDYAGRSVVLSGDTRSSENLVRHAQGVDVLIHEVASPESFRRAHVPAERAASVLAHHVTPEQAGRLFARVRPRLAVYSHIVLPGARESDLITQTRTVYAGPLEVGHDLMRIEVGDEIRVHHAPAAAAPND